MNINVKTYITIIIDKSRWFVRGCQFANVIIYFFTKMYKASPNHCYSCDSFTFWQCHCLTEHKLFNHFSVVQKLRGGNLLMASGLSQNTLHHQIISSSVSWPKRWNAELMPQLPSLQPLYLCSASVSYTQRHAPLMSLMAAMHMISVWCAALANCWKHEYSSLVWEGGLRWERVWSAWKPMDLDGLIQWRGIMYYMYAWDSLCSSGKDASVCECACVCMSI